MDPARVHSPTTINVGLVSIAPSLSEDVLQNLKETSICFEEAKVLSSVTLLQKDMHTGKKFSPSRLSCNGADFAPL